MFLSWAGVFTRRACVATQARRGTERFLETDKFVLGRLLATQARLGFTGFSFFRLTFRSGMRI